MQNPDSFDRIVSYFQALARKPFEYQGRFRAPYASLVVSEKVFRDYTCPEGCGACCMKCSLVFDRAFPDEGHDSSELHQLESFVVNGKRLDFPVDRQEGNDGRYCKHLSSTGRCGIYEYRPLPCRFELFKFVHKISEDRAYAMVRLPGRAYKLLRVDNELGAKCEIRPYNPKLTETHIRDLRIIERWMSAFNIEHDCEAVISYLQSGPYAAPLVIKRKETRGLL